MRDTVDVHGIPCQIFQTCSSRFPAHQCFLIETAEGLLEEDLREVRPGLDDIAAVWQELQVGSRDLHAQIIAKGLHDLGAELATPQEVEAIEAVAVGACVVLAAPALVDPAFLALPGSRGHSLTRHLNVDFEYSSFSRISIDLTKIKHSPIGLLYFLHFYLS